MAAIHLDNLLFLLFLAIAFFFQLLTRAAKKTGQRPGDTTRRSTSQRSRPLISESDETDQERVRKFLEALGQPTTAKPPEPIRPRPTYDRPAVLPQAPPPLPRQIRLPGQIPPTREAKTFRARIPEAPKFEVHDVNVPLQTPPVIKTPAEAYAIATQPISKPAEKKIDLAAMLRSTSGLRDAIILREVFGPPRSMQPLDLRML